MEKNNKTAMWILIILVVILFIKTESLSDILRGLGGNITDGNGRCIPDWECTDWGPCIGYQARTCIDKNNCGTLSGRPPLVQSCTPPEGTNLYCGDGICGGEENEANCPDCATQECDYQIDCEGIGDLVYCIDIAYPPTDTEFVLCEDGEGYAEGTNFCLCSALVYEFLELY